MGARGPKSKAEIILQEADRTATMERPEPPYGLTDAQCTVWYAVTNRLPADWFRDENTPLLAQYCRHVVEADRIASMLARMNPNDDGFELSEYEKLLKMQDKETRALSTMATKMRLTQQARYTKGSAGTGANKDQPSKKLWQQ